ncbi:MAG: acetylglutamate kinase [Bacillota bacterium]
MDELIAKAEVLSEALPYLRAFYGQTVVIKYGGAAMSDAARRKTVVQDIVLLRYIGLKPVVVHGGGPEISAFLRRLGKESRFTDGRRETDAETAAIVEMVLAGKLNKDLVSLLNEAGGQAVGVSGKDGNLITARPLGSNGDRTGDVAAVNPALLHTLTAAGYIPVVAPTGAGPGGDTFNINADTVAGNLAAAVQAGKLVLLTDVPGVTIRDQILAEVSASQVQRYIAGGLITGGMIPKVEACLVAAEGGVPRCHIIDGRLHHALLLEIFTDRGVGTMVTREMHPEAPAGIYHVE